MGLSEIRLRLGKGWIDTHGFPICVSWNLRFKSHLWTNAHVFLWMSSLRRYWSPQLEGLINKTTNIIQHAFLFSSFPQIVENCGYIHISALSWAPLAKALVECLLWRSWSWGSWHFMASADLRSTWTTKWAQQKTGWNAKTTSKVSGQGSLHETMWNYVNY